MIKKSIALVCSLLVLAALAGCNTTRGAGEDVEAGGQAIQRAAQQFSLPCLLYTSFVLPTDTNYKDRDTLVWEVNYRFLEPMLADSLRAVAMLSLIHICPQGND